MFETAIIENIIGYTFIDKSLLTRAFTHSSFSEYSYERLEFLGDSVLGVIVSDYLFSNYKDLDPGDLTLIRKNIVDKPPLKKSIQKLNLNKYVLLGKGEKQNHLENTEKICGDLYESILGAIYIDGGLLEATAFVISTLEETIIQSVKNKNSLIDFKSKLLQYCQKNRLKVDFECTKQGEDHKPIFDVSLLINGEKVANAKGTKKQDAEKFASEIALKKLTKKL